MRSLVRNALGSDATLNSLGISTDHIWPNFALDASPRADGPWLVLRWGSSPARFGRQPGGATALTVWAYVARQRSTDHSDLVAILERTSGILLSMEHAAGDGWIVSTVDFRGYSEDLQDAGYDAIAKNAAYTVIARRA